MTKTDVRRWLALHPALSMRKLGVEMGFAEGKMFRLALGKTAPEAIPQKLQGRMLPVLERYGFRCFVL